MSGASTGSMAQAEDFQRRAAELVAARKEATAAGPAPKSKRKRVKTRPAKMGEHPRFKLRGQHLKALAGGLAAVFIARALRFYLGGAPMLDQGTEIYWVSDMLIAGVGAFVLRKIAVWDIRSYLYWYLGGATIMLMGMHNIIHKFPAEFAFAFTPQYVESVMTSTPPNSLVFRGTVLDKNGLSLMSASSNDTGYGAPQAPAGCSPDAISGLVGGDLVSSMAAVQGACF